MADDEETTPTPADAGLDQRVSSLEGKIDTILDKLSGGAPAPADPKQQPGGTNVAHEIRQQLDERDARAREDAEKNGVKTELGEVKAKLAELTEQAPAPMPRRIERIMGWS